mmetsp:Transcript_12651/g.46719  ORF Transcript_12651/g.46719 Transcript_12651/m.46719 type:complete len:240 (-) Transcript_12651:981-1700(-)
MLLQHIRPLLLVIEVHGALAAAENESEVLLGERRLCAVPLLELLDHGKPFSEQSAHRSNPGSRSNAEQRRHMSRRAVVQASIRKLGQAHLAGPNKESHRRSWRRRSQVAGAQADVCSTVGRLLTNDSNTQVCGIHICRAGCTARQGELSGDDCGDELQKRHQWRSDRSELLQDVEMASPLPDAVVKKKVVSFGRSQLLQLVLLVFVLRPRPKSFKKRTGRRSRKIQEALCKVGQRATAR